MDNNNSGERRSDSRLSFRCLGAAIFAAILPGPVAADSSEPGATTDLSQLPLETLMSIEAYGASKFMQKIIESPTAVSIVPARDIKSTATAHRQDILGGIKDTPVLMLGDSEDYAAQDAAINFYLEGNKVRFEINMGAAARSGLEISPQLLKLARILRESGGHDEPDCAVSGCPRQAEAGLHHLPVGGGAAACFIYEAFLKIVHPEDRKLLEGGVCGVLEQLARTAWITAFSCRTERCG